MGRNSDPLVGRAGELAVLDRLLEATRTGAANAVFLAGEPGIGKTSVLAELVGQATARGCLVLEGSAAEFEQELPFGVVIDAIDAYVASLDSSAVARLAADGLQELAEVFPALRSLRAGTAGTATATERFRNYYAVRELFERLAARQPMVLVLDDLHWADMASLELVAHLLRRPPDAPVLLAGSFRTGQVQASLVAAIDVAERAGKAERIPLGPLAPGEAETLLGDVDRARSGRLYLESGGNPFYLLQLARSGAAGARRSREEGDEVPAAVVAAIARELGALGGPTRAFAEAAAVVGDPFDLDVAAATASVDEPAALTALDALIAGDLVRHTQVPRRFAFRHPLVRAAVYEASSASTRLAAHARCGDALAAQGAPATSRAHHVEQSARRGDRAAIDLLVGAAQATAPRLPPSAARWYQAALRLLPEGGPPDERVALLEARAGVLTTAGDLLQARAALLEALALVPPGAGAGPSRVRLTAACAGVEQRLGHQEEAHARLVAGLAELTDRATDEGVALMVALAADAFYRIEYPAMREWGAAAVEGAAHLDSRPLVAAAEAVLAMACALIGDTAEAEAHRSVCAALVDGMADVDVGLRLDALGHLVGAELYLEHFEETATHAKRGIELSRAAGHGEIFPTLLPALGTATWVLGRLAESAEVLDGAVEVARLTGNVQTLAWGLFNRSISALMAGDMETAMRTGHESVEAGQVLDDGFLSAHARIMLASAIIESGDAAIGVEMLVAAGGGDEIPVVPGGWRAMFLEILARGWLALDRLDEARLAAERAHAVAAAVGLPRPASLAHRASAAVALHVGDPATAVNEAALSVAAAEKADARVDAAMARVVLGRSLAAAGEMAAGVAALDRASTDFEAYGATRYRDQADQELRKLGHHVHRRTMPGRGALGIEALSGRELEVAGLVVDRRTNPEIAAELFLSLKTVETHMRNIFRKLGVSSRVEVARLAERAVPAP